LAKESFNVRPKLQVVTLAKVKVPSERNRPVKNRMAPN